MEEQKSQILLLIWSADNYSNEEYYYKIHFILMKSKRI